MSTEELRTSERQDLVKKFAESLRHDANLLLNESYLENIIRMNPGVEESYFYELRKILNH
jgi:hypothetical protein